jgi:hypothetical protein
MSDQAITFTSEELTALSDVLRRQDPDSFPVGAIFLTKDEFKTAYVKIETAKHASFKEEKAK